ncbi:MAG: preprotein translocase subunit YajC [Planctomycetota bacterium]
MEGESIQQPVSGSGPGNQPAQPDAWVGALFPLIAMGIIFWLFFIRPEHKRRKEKQNLLGNLKVKDKVITIGGVHGVVAELDGDNVFLIIDSKKDVKIHIRRSAVDVIESEAKK